MKLKGIVQPCFGEGKLALSSRKSFIIFFVAVLALSFARAPLPSSATSDSQEKALSFLRDVIQLDMSKYTTTLVRDNAGTSGSGEIPMQYLEFNLNSLESHATAIIKISNDTLFSCYLYTNWGVLLYAHSYSDSFDAASRIIRKYRTWANDSKIEQMSNLLDKVGSTKNATETSDNMTLRVSVRYYGDSFDWKNTFNGAEYSGVSLYFSSQRSSLDFHDDRTIYKIGNTNLNVSKEQAIAIAKDYVGNYSYTLNFANGTIHVDNLNVTDVGTKADLQTSLRGNATLYPYWNVLVRLDHVYPGNTEAIYVGVWADDGTVYNAYRVANVPGLIDPLSLIFLPIIGSSILALFSIVAGGIALSIALLIFIRMNRRKKK
jgi:hypothetical protein